MWFLDNGCEVWIEIHCLPMDVQLVQHQLLKDYLWPWNCLCPSVANQLAIYMGLFPGSWFCLLIYVSIPLPIPLCFDCCCFEEIRSSKFSNIILFFYKFIYFIFLAALGLCCCAWGFSSCDERGLLFIAVRGLLIVVASLVVEHGL